MMPSWGRLTLKTITVKMVGQRGLIMVSVKVMYYLMPGKGKKPLKATKKRGVPEGAIWSGPITVGYEGDLMEAHKLASRTWYSAWRKWLAEKKWLTKKVGTAAPAFKEHAKQLLAKNLANEPVIDFDYEERGAY